jgi:carbamoyltransferase
LVQDGEIVAAAQEERFTRKKHDSSFPANAAVYCLSEDTMKLRTSTMLFFMTSPS